VTPETFRVEVAGVVRELPVHEIAPGVRIAHFNLLGDAEVVKAAATELARRLAGARFDVLLTAEAKSVPLAYELALQTGKPWVVLRKSRKPYMEGELSAETVSITTGSPQTLWLDGRDRERIAGRTVALVDDVVSTGSTLAAMRELVRAAGAEVAVEAAVFIEGDSAAAAGVVALGHLPLFS
jgi:adenine phosphoribosyltransferase